MKVNKLHNFLKIFGEDEFSRAENSSKMQKMTREYKSFLSNFPTIAIREVDNDASPERGGDGKSSSGGLVQIELLKFVHRFQNRKQKAFDNQSFCV